MRAVGVGDQDVKNVRYGGVDWGDGAWGEGGFDEEVDRLVVRKREKAHQRPKRSREVNFSFSYSHSPVHTISPGLLYARGLFGPRLLSQHDYKQVYFLNKKILSCRALDMRNSRPLQIIPPETHSSSLLSPPPPQLRLAGHNPPLALAKPLLAKSLSRMIIPSPQIAPPTRRA